MTSSSHGVGGFRAEPERRLHCPPHAAMSNAHELHSTADPTAAWPHRQVDGTHRLIGCVSPRRALRAGGAAV